MKDAQYDMIIGPLCSKKLESEQCSKLESERMKEKERILKEEIENLKEEIEKIERQTKRIKKLESTKLKEEIENLKEEIEKIERQTKRIKELESTKKSATATCKISRYPTIESPDEILVDQEFALQISLTEDLMTPKVYVKSFNKESVALTAEGQMVMDLLNQEKWKIDVTLFAPAFSFSKGGNTSSMILPKSGDSTPAIFHLKAKPIKLYATLWHEDTYLAKIVREITVRNSSAKPKLLVNTTPEENTGKGSSAIQRKAETESPILFNLDLEKPDLTVFMFEDSDADGSGEGFIEIRSPYFPEPFAQPYKTPPGLSEWLDGQYKKIIQYGNLEKKQIVSLIQGFGRNLYQKAAPCAFREAFWLLADKLGADFDSIQILSNNPLLPWELMKPERPDGSEKKDFLGLDFKIGRWHISQGSFRWGRPLQSVVFEELVVIAPQYQGKETLPGQNEEIRILESIRGYRRIPGQFDSIKALFERFPRGIIHFAGHGIIRRSEKGIADYLIRLEDAELDVLAWRGMIQGSTDQSPFFFFNACDVGKAEQIANFVDGWAPAVLEAGACGYVGALWPLNDRGAVEFSTHFYETMDEELKTNSADIAEILRQTRRLFLENGDPTFLAYIFYGDPYLRLVQN
jgi:hypothetical protein